ncbi:MAG: hypothetical protein O8C66_08655 [Candidatus Methanoperedens sp.]|nr:hypothetical protein [Candidatus Methanoperedens sp.]MCZ7370565.1 hypothetical protein [Candidatus Methanoperedens sp.]
MKKIASREDIDIFAPHNSRFSFLKSPYAAHKTFSAVDIYYGDFGSEALSPVDGKIIDIRSFDTPTPFKNRDSKEYVMALEQGGHVIKILHIKPDVSIGMEISKGDKIGTFVRNGYFIFWNDPVMHVEVRKSGDYLRASNDLPLTPYIEWEDLPSSKSLELVCRVEKILDNYSLLCAPYDTCGNVMGFAMCGGFIDGYISSDHDEGFFGIVNPQGFLNPQVSELEITSGGKEIKCSGISFCLSLTQPRIKVIPKKYGDKPFSPDEEVRIRIKVL